MGLKTTQIGKIFLNYIFDTAVTSPIFKSGLKVGISDLFLRKQEFIERIWVP